MQQVTDPSILAKLNSTSTAGMKEVTDANILTKLNNTTISPPQQQQPPAQISNENLKPVAGYSDNTLSRIANSPIVNKINALGGGAQETLANSIKYGGGLIGDVTNSPGITNATEKASQVLQPPEFVKQSMEENPMTSMAGNAIGGGIAMGLTGGIANAILPDAAATAAANFVLGAATSGQGLTNRLIGGTAGTLLGKAADVAGGFVGKAISQASNTLNLTKTLKDVVGKANAVLQGQSSDQAAMASVKNMWSVATKVRESLYNGFKNVPGDVNAAPISSAAKDILNKYGKVMTQGQKGVFSAITAHADNVSNMDSLHELYKFIGDQKSLFLKSGTAPDVLDAFKSLAGDSKQKIIGLAESLLKSNAERLGVGDELAIAQKFNREVIAPLQKFGADKIARGEVSTDGFLAKYIKPPSALKPEGTPESLGKLLNAMDSNGREIVTSSLIGRIAKTIDVGADGTNPLKGVKDIQSYVNLYGDKLGPSAVNQLLGMQKILKETSLIPSSAMKQFQGVLKQMSLPIIGAIGAGGYGATQGHGVSGTLADVGIGFAGTFAIEKMLSSEAGRVALQFLGEHKAGAAMAKTMIGHFLAAGAGKVENKLSQ